MLSPERKARLIEEFDAFRGVETLVDGPRFEVLKANYTAILEGLTTQKTVAADLTPEKYLTFRIMARELSKQQPGVTADLLARGMISTYIQTGDFIRPVLAAGFSKREVKKARSSAAAAIKIRYQTTSAEYSLIQALPIIWDRCQRPLLGRLSFGINLSNCGPTFTSYFCLRLYLR